MSGVALADRSELEFRPSDLDASIEQLGSEGFCIVRNALGRTDIARIARELEPAFQSTAFSQGLFYGERTVRFGRLLARSPATAKMVASPSVLGVVERVLGRWHRQIHLSFTQAIAVHPGARMQAPHRDEEMWPCVKEDAEYLINVIWPLDTFTPQNGATRLWPGSNRGMGRPPAEPICASAEPGDALVFLGSTLHAGGPNVTRNPRRALVFGYSAAWLTPSENPILACPPDVARTLPREVAELAGYRRVAPNLNNFDCRCPSEVLTGSPMADGAVDELRREDEQALEQYFAHLELAEAS